MPTPNQHFAVIPFLLEDRERSETMKAIKTIMGSCDRAIAKAAPNKQAQELHKAIFEELKAANQVAHLEWHDFTVIYRPDTDRDGNNVCGEIFALETSDGKQHFPPFIDLAGFVIPTVLDISAEIEELEDRVQPEEFMS